MWNWIFAIALASAPLLFGEVLVKALRLKQEPARKFIHLFASLVSICLLLFLELDQIAILAVVMVPALLVVRKIRLVTALYGVDRKSYGEIFFPLGVASAALLAPSEIVYIAAMCIVGMADTAANMVGGRYGKHPYRVFGIHKTAEGSLAFFVISLGILFGLSTIGYEELIIIALAATFTEAVSIVGSDNLTVPLAVCLSASLL